jgi:hypothetical protein
MKFDQNISKVSGSHVTTPELRVKRSVCLSQVCSFKAVVTCLENSWQIVWAVETKPLGLTTAANWCFIIFKDEKFSFTAVQI